MTDRDSRPEPPELVDLEPLEPAEEERLAALLRHAFAPTDIAPERHERLLAGALEDPFRPASAEELVESERLRRALEGEGEHPDLSLARALAAAHAPTAPRGVSLERAADELARRRPATVSYLRFGGIMTAFAVAAAVLLSLSSRPGRAPAPELQALLLAQSRSTAPLFRSAATPAAPSRRIDRIASVRERELRENRYALWGVR